MWAFYEHVAVLLWLYASRDEVGAVVVVAKFTFAAILEGRRSACVRCSADERSVTYLCLPKFPTGPLAIPARIPVPVACQFNVTYML